MRAARRALGKRQTQDERSETCADGVRGEERRGEEKRKREGGGERGGREKEIARREARTWQATERREREEGGETSARRRRAHLLESDGQVKKEKRRGKEEKGGAHLTSTTPRPVPAAPNAHCSSGGLRHRAMQHSLPSDPYHSTFHCGKWKQRHFGPVATVEKKSVRAHPLSLAHCVAHTIRPVIPTTAFDPRAPD